MGEDGMGRCPSQITQRAGRRGPTANGPGVPIPLLYHESQTEFPLHDECV